MSQNDGYLIDEDEQARYDEWCEQMGYDSAEDHWMEYYEKDFPED